MRTRFDQLDIPRTLITAAWVAPITSAVIPDGAVLITGDRITAVGDARQLRRDHPDAAISDAGNAVLLPGLVNAHVHLEFSGCIAGAAPASFTDWLMSLPQRIGQERDFAAAATIGAGDSIRFGVTTVGDISQHAQLTRAALRNSPLRLVSYGEVIGIGGTRYKVDELLERAIDQSAASDRLTIGISPHAPYSLEPDDYCRVAAAARDRRLPLATHLAELPAEQAFLQHHRGAFRELFERWGIWRDDIATFPGGPIELAKAAGILDTPTTLLAHVNYCSDEELATLAAGQASIVCCPRTHAYFRHPPHRWPEMLAAGINVAVGTDSCASSPDLNLVDDLRLMRRLAPQVSPQALWEMATIRAARAIGMQASVGSLEPGKFADLSVFDVRGADPLAEILQSDSLPSSVWIGGKREV